MILNRVILFFFFVIIFGRIYSQSEYYWKGQFEQGLFYSLEKELNSDIYSNHPKKKEAFKLLGEIYKVRGDIETANFFWKKSDSILLQTYSGWNSKAIQLAHQSNYFYEKFNHNKTQTYNDSLLFVLKKINEISISDYWIWNVVAQSNKLILSKTNKGIFLFSAYDKEVIHYYKKAIKQYSKSEEYQFDLARSYHLYANALVDVIHAINRDSLNIELKLKLEKKANRLYDRAISIYKVNFDENHFEIARILYVKALLYQYAHPEPTLDEREKAINLYELALQSFNLEKPSLVVNITEALGAAKQYHRALFQSYRINPTNQLKLKQDSIFGLHNEFWKDSLNTFQTENPNQLISLYGLSPYTERLKQIYFLNTSV